MCPAAAAIGMPSKGVPGVATADGMRAGAAAAAHQATDLEVEEARALVVAGAAGGAEKRRKPLKGNHRRSDTRVAELGRPSATEARAHQFAESLSG